MKKISSIGLAVLLALMLAVPSFAAESVPETPLPEAAPSAQEASSPAPEAASNDGGAAPETAPSSDNALSETPGPSDGGAVPDTAEPSNEINALLDGDPAVIDVVVPQTGEIVINPYRLSVELDGGQISTDQIAGDPLTITNNGDGQVIVGVQAKGESNTVHYVATQPAADETAKVVFLYAEFKDANSDWLNHYDADADNQLLISSQTSDEKPVLTLAAKSEGLFQLFGAASVKPATAWNEDDEISVTFTFTFTADTAAGAAINELPDNEPAVGDETADEPVTGDVPANAPVSETPIVQDEEPANDAPTPGDNTASGGEEPSGDETAPGDETLSGGEDLSGGEPVVGDGDLSAGETTPGGEPASGDGQSASDSGQPTSNDGETASGGEPDAGGEPSSDEAADNSGTTLENTPAADPAPDDV